MNVKAVTRKEDKGVWPVYTKVWAEDDPCKGGMPTQEAPSFLDGLNVIHWPTHNCQFASVSYAAWLFQSGYTYVDDPQAIGGRRSELVQRDRKDFLKVIHTIWGQVRKPMLLIDIKSSYHARFHEFIPKKYIRFGGPYVSTNGSSMGMWLVDIRAMLTDEGLLKKGVDY